MAIPFLNNINLDDNQLLNAKLHVTSSAPTAAQGQIYFDSTLGTATAKYYDGGDWVDIKDPTYSNGTYVDFTLVGSNARPTLTVDLSAIDGTASVGERYLAKSGVWATIASIPGTYTFDVSDGTNTETINSGDTVTWNGTGTTTVSYSTGTNTFTINSADQFTGTVTSVGTSNSTFISGSGGPITTSGSLTYSLSATGTPSSSTYLRGDNTWATLPADNDNYVDSISFNTGTGVLTLGRTGALADLTQSLDGRYLTGNETITLTGEVTGSGTTSITTTVANGVLDVANFNASAIVIESEGIENNDNDTTLPTSAAVKAYVDAATVGGLVYQGGYDANLNIPDLTTSPNSIEKGWTYTVTADGTFFGEQLRVGDVLIAEIDDPSALADWTTVQNNIDLASLVQVGIGNVNEATASPLDGLSVTYSSGTATVGLDIDSLAQGLPSSGNEDSYLAYYDDGAGANKKLDFSQLAGEINSVSSYAATITDTATITHSLATRDVIIQLYDTVTYETVYADVDRISTTQATITFATTPTNSIRVLVQKIG